MNALHLAFAALLVAANGFFVGAEFALVSVRRSQIEPRAAAGSARARRVLYGLEHLPQMMAAAQFGITVCSLTLGALAEPAIASLLEPAFHAAHVPHGLIHPLGYAVSLAVVVCLHLVVGEMVPKNLALAAPAAAALWLAPALVAFARLCRPATALLGALARRLLRLVRVEPRSALTSVYTTEQLTDLVADSREAGLLGDGEQRRLNDALGLGSRPVTDVLLDPASMVAVPASVTPRQVEELTVRTGYSRFPVRGDGGTGAADAAGPRYLGYLHVKDVLDLEERERAVPAHLFRPMTVLRPELPLDDALAAMRRGASHLAAVADPAAPERVLGLVALEDVLELLVGEVRDPAHRLTARQRTADGAAAASVPASVG
ncbi:CNNM domain-containing protein [Streptomyces sp. WMMC500]|uniref:CNNM domain-containing protein n=1 Tax=Streptomyces sp. WMMC500 TaxID=3015154 RepID=UPI00248AF87A|nr:CNNM domain-containing protein [Streptomyces sp. WMMC500]WBB61134.1 CNNM domain-containing protein [Streptomyces sp. WMMC500]